MGATFTLFLMQINKKHMNNRLQKPIKAGVEYKQDAKILNVETHGFVNATEGIEYDMKIEKFE